MLKNEIHSVLLINGSPKQVFDAICNVPAWWTSDFIGAATKAGDVFEVKFGDVHHSTQQVKELIESEKVVWEVTQSHLSFLNQKDEWTGTHIEFQIRQRSLGSELILIHHGLNNESECYEACQPAWHLYMQNSLKHLVETGIGQPGFPPEAVEENTKDETDFSCSFQTQASAADLYASVVNVPAWWSEEVKGGTAAIGDEFHYHYGDVHVCRMRVLEAEPEKKMVWQVLENSFSFEPENQDWTNNLIEFVIKDEGLHRTLTLTQKGLKPFHNCYQVCSDAWTGYINGSLKSLAETGKGMPNPKEN